MRLIALVHDWLEYQLIIMQKRAWRIQGLPKFFEYPILSQERVKLRTSNFVCTIHGIDWKKCRF